MCCMSFTCAVLWQGDRCSACARNPNYFRYQGTCRVCPKGHPIWFTIGFGILAAVFFPIAFKLSGIISKIPSLTITLNFAQVWSGQP